MRRFVVFAVLVTAMPAWAGAPEAREIARLNNCPPKKIDVYQSQTGGGHTIYQATCNLPKQTDAVSGAPDGLLIDCDGPMCSLLRPISLTK